MRHHPVRQTLRRIIRPGDELCVLTSRSPNERISEGPAVDPSTGGSHGPDKPGSGGVCAEIFGDRRQPAATAKRPVPPSRSAGLSSARGKGRASAGPPRHLQRLPYSDQRTRASNGQTVSRLRQTLPALKSLASPCLQSLSVTRHARPRFEWWDALSQAEPRQLSAAVPISSSAPASRPALQRSVGLVRGRRPQVRGDQRSPGGKFGQPGFCLAFADGVRRAQQSLQCASDSRIALQRAIQPAETA